MKNIAFISILFVLFFSCKKEQKIIPSKIINKPIVIASKEKNSSEIIVEKIIENKFNIIKQLKANPTNANKLYVAFRNHTDSLVIQLEKSEERLLANYLSFDYNKKSKKVKIPDSIKDKVTMIGNAELEIWAIGEGLYEIRTKPNYYYTIFRDYVSPDYKQYLKLEAEENEILFSSDASISLSWEDVSKRVINWEQFLRDYPRSHLFQDAREKYKFYLLAYLFGSDNTPVIKDAGKDIYPERRMEFNRFMLLNPAAKTTKIIKIYLDNLQKMNYNELYKFMENEQKKFLIQNKLQ